jgi:hypothetical protein
MYIPPTLAHHFPLMINLRNSILLIGCGLLAIGCAGRAQLWPNSDPALRHTSAEFADAPRGGTAIGRAQVGYTLNKIEILNNGDQDWNDVEVWINKAYVIHLPLLKARAEKVTTLPFQAIFDDQGHSFPTDNSKILVNKVEVYHDGKMYDVPSQLAD